MFGKQGGFTKYSCFLCLWDSRDRENHYNHKVWQTKENLEKSFFNVIEEPLVDASKILLPPLHIKLGLMKQFVNSLDKNSTC